MVDLHCHILPGVDDGAQTLEDSLDMARAAVQEGITKIVATPHHHTSRYNTPKEMILNGVNVLNEKLNEYDIPLEVLPGQEVRLFGEIMEEYENGQVTTINGSHYILIEFPSNHVPSYSERLFYDIQMQGLVPVVVHPERNSDIIQNPEKLYHLIEKGALSQITAGSLIGSLGKKIQKFTFQLIESNLTHCVASDAHNITTRPFKMQEAYQLLEKQYGMELLFQFRENAEYMINGNTIYSESPIQIKKKRILGLF